MTRVIFETSYMNLLGFVFIIGTVCEVLFLYFICFKGLIKIDKRIRIKGRRLGVFRFLEKIVLFLMLKCIIDAAGEYIDIVVKYKLGHYIEIEGSVEGYSYGSDWEGTTFTVDGVEFRCPNSAWGYEPTDENNLEIIENGQYVKIRYIPLKEKGNVIVYIKQLRPKESNG